jgi:murein DD-endopeptidase MepM/ murein hydrolase activator NlpD
VTRRVVALALLALLPVSAFAATHRARRPAPPRHGSTLERSIELQRERTRVFEYNLHRARIQLHFAAARVNDLQGQLDETNSAIGGVDERLGYLGAEQHETERRLTWYARQLAAAKRSLQLQDSLLAQRLVGIYEYGTPNYLSVLLAARSFSDFVESWDDLRLLITANERAVRQREATAKRVLAIQQNLRKNQIALQDEEQQQDQTRSQLSALAGERRNLVGIAQRDRQIIATHVVAMENLTAAQEAQLEALIQRRQREIAQAEGIAGEAAHSNGYFSWPIIGIITSPFGWRENPFGGGPEFHQGLDIAAPLGTTVKAAAAGTVIMAQWYGGYGNYILIDNGNHYSTGYGHLSAIYVTRGQYVQRGQAIGAVGSTGYSTGPHLHFEVRIDGKPVDPAPRLIH